jgi:hypothetical protein
MCAGIPPPGEYDGPAAEVRPLIVILVVPVARGKPRSPVPANVRAGADFMGGPAAAGAAGLVIGRQFARFAVPSSST